MRDRVVVGLLDADLSERLQLLSDLDLATAVTKARNSEAVKAQQSIVRGSQATPTLCCFSDAVHSYAQQDRPQRQRPFGKEEKRTPSKSMPSSRNCQWCGKDKHPRGKCPPETQNAYNAAR